MKFYNWSFVIDSWFFLNELSWTKVEQWWTFNWIGFQSFWRDYFMIPLSWFIVISILVWGIFRGLVNPKLSSVLIDLLFGRQISNYNVSSTRNTNVKAAFKLMKGDIAVFYESVYIPSAQTMLGLKQNQNSIAESVCRIDESVSIYNWYFIVGITIVLRFR